MRRPTPVAEGDDSGLVPLGSVIPVPPDFAAIFERNGDLANFHRRLESEPENAEWARRIEDILQNMFLSKLDPSAYVVSTLECRATACEILAMGYGDDALRNWMAAIAGLEDSDQDFGELFGGPGNFGCGAGNVAPGIYALNCTLQRVDPPPEGAEPAETFSLSAPYEDGITVEPVVVADAAVEAIESSADLYNLHRQLEREATDYGWSNYIEPLLAEYVQSLGAESGMSLLGVTCRTTLCEVQMLATNDQAMMMWVPSMLEFQQLDWHDLGIAGLDTSDVPDGEPTGVVWILQRRPPQ